MIEQLSDDVELGDEILSVGIFVDDKEHISGVEADASLEVFFEIDVPGHGLAIAVESKADEIAVSIKHRRTTVATGDVVSGDEAGGQFAVFVSVWAKVVGLVEFF